MLYMFFWVSPRRQIVVFRRFGTFYHFHLHAPHPAFEDGTDRPQSDAGEIPKRTYTTFKTRRKFEVKDDNNKALAHNAWHLWAIISESKT